MPENPESSDQMLEAVLASMGEAVLVVEPDGRKIRNCNAEAERLFGYEKGELIGKNTEVLHVDREHFERFGELGEPVLERGEVFRTEYQMKQKDGTIFDTYNTVSPIRKDQGWKAGVVSIIRDITDQKETERKLKNERNRLEEAQRIGRIGDWYYHLETGEITWSPMMYEIYERDPESGPPAYEKVLSYYPEGENHHVEKIEKAVEERISYSDDTRIITEKGNERFVHVEGIPVKNEEGEVVKLHGIVQDITERKKAQRRMEHEWKRFNQLYKNKPVAIAITDTEGTVRDVNPAFEGLFGFSNEEAVGQNLAELITQSEQGRQEAVRNRRRLMEEGHFFKETERFDKEGRSVDVIIGGACMEENGEITTLFHIYTDFTRIKKLEREKKRLLERERELRAKAEESREKFKEMVQTAPSAIALLEGPEHRFTYVNKRYRELFRKKEFVDRTVGEVFPEIEEQGFNDLLNQVYNSGEPYYAEEQSIKLWDELDEEWYELAMNFVYKPITDGEGKIYGIFVEVVDVTDEVHYREELKKKLNEKKTLLEEMHHRVKNNLAVTTGLLYMQMEESGEERVKKDLGEAYNRIQSIALVHEQLYQQAETSAQINLSNYVPQLIDRVQLISESPNKDITTDVNAEQIHLPLTKAIPTGLLTTELLMNAYKHAFKDREEGHIQIDIWEDGKVHLQLSDNGVGLPEDFNLETGSMGMEIIQMLSTQLDADLSYNSVSGEGTTFSLTYGLEE